MKFFFSIILTLLLTAQSYAEINSIPHSITFPEHHEKISNSDNYCSDSYYGEDYKNYLGEKLILRSLHKNVESIGYSFFYKDYRSSSNYSGIDRISPTDFGSYYRGPDKSSQLKGTVFEVTDIISGIWIFSFLELKNTETSEIVYFQYNKNSMFFPFYSSCYLNTIKNEIDGKSYRSTGIGWEGDGSVRDISTGREVRLRKGDLFKYVDVVLDAEGYGLSVIVEAQNGSQLALPYNHRFDGRYVYIDQRDVYEKKFGKEYWEYILNGKIKLGMTEEMVLLVLGKPIKINTVNYTNTDRQLWLYDDKRLFFDDNVLTVVRDYTN